MVSSRMIGQGSMSRSSCVGFRQLSFSLMNIGVSGNKVFIVLFLLFHGCNHHGTLYINHAHSLTQRVAKEILNERFPQVRRQAWWQKGK